MEEQFSLTERLLGKDAMAILHDSRVIVFGIGGVGGHAVEALVRAGIGRIDLVDNDCFCDSNLNRQLFATRKTIGKYKVDAAAERIADINPGCRVTVHKMFYLPEAADQFDFKQYSYIVDAIDTVAGKIGLAVAAAEAGVPIISAMGAGNKLNPADFEVADIYQTAVCPLAHVMRKELRKRGVAGLKVVYSKEKPLKPLISSSEKVNASRKIAPGSVSFVPSVVGLIMAGEVIKDLIRLADSHK